MKLNRRLSKALLCYLASFEKKAKFTLNLPVTSVKNLGFDSVVNLTVKDLFVVLSFTATANIYQAV